VALELAQLPRGSLGGRQLHIVSCSPIDSQRAIVFDVGPFVF